MRKYALLLFVLAFCRGEIFSQDAGKKSVVIGTMVNRPNALLILNPPNGDQGILLPQLTTIQRTSILPQSPADDGLLVFDIDVKAFYFWKDNIWNKGLGNDGENQTIQFNATTNHLTLTLGGGDIDLSTLKELPTVTGQAGKYITTDGNNITWATLPTGNGITGIVAGAGLTGGGTTGNIPVGIKTDNTSIVIDGSNAIALKDGAVTSTKLALNAVTTQTIKPGTNNTVLTTDNTGAVKWSAPVTSPDNQTLALTGNTLQITNGNSVLLNAGGQISGPLNNLVVGNDVISSANIVDGTVSSADIKDNTIAPSDIASGGINKVLTSDATGTVIWAAPAAVTDNQQLGYNNATQQLSLNNSIPADLSSLKELPTMSGNNGRFLMTNGASSTWSDLNASGQLSGTLGNLAINNSTVSTAMIVDGTLLPGDLASGGNDKVLMTDATGVVNWGSKASLLSGVLSSGSIAGGDLSGTYPNPAIGVTSGNNIISAINNPVTTNTILGNKVNPNFGAQNINTTGSLTAGATTINSTLLVSNTPTMTTLAGVGSRMVVANATGVLSTQSIPALVTGNLTTSTTGVSILNGTNAVAGSGTSISIQTASSSQPGLLSSADFTTFNNKVGQVTLPAAGDMSGSFNAGFQLGAGVVGDTEISGISPSKISQAGAINGEILKWNGTAWTPQPDASIPSLTVNQIVTNDGSANVARTINGDATFNGVSGALSISNTAGTNIINAVNNTGTVGTLNTNRLAPTVVLETESPVGGSVGGSFAGGLTLNNNAVSTATIITQAVDASKIKPGTADQMLVTDATGTNAIWVNIADVSPTNELITNVQLLSNTLTITEAGTNHTQILDGLALTGDVTGNLNTNKVTKIQGTSVSATAPTDQQVLVYDNSTSQWKATTVAGLSSFVDFKVAQNSNQTISGTVLLVWDTETYDDGNNFSLNQFTAPTSGLYHFDVLVTIQQIGKGDLIETILRVNSTDVQRSSYVSGVKNSDASSHMSTDLKLKTGDKVSVWVNVPNYDTKGGGINTQFSGRKIY